MSDKIEKTPEELEKEAKRIAYVEASRVKRIASAKLKYLQGDSDWTLIEQLLQEMEADYIVNSKKVNITEIRKKLIEDVKVRYADDPELLEEIMEAMPSIQYFHKITQKKGYSDAVWAKIRGTGLFTQDKRQTVIQTLYKNVTENGDNTAAKIWLTLSGDYVEKADGKQQDAVMDVFRNINEQLHTKK